MREVLPVIAVVAIMWAAAPAQAQDISSCTSAGYSAACCRESVAKFGAFGQAAGKRQQHRRAALEACKARGAKSK